MDNSGPAFPHTYDMVNGGNERGGMTLRDYFAAAVLKELLPGVERAYLNDESNTPLDVFILSAERAYAYADAMLKVRSK